LCNFQYTIVKQIQRAQKTAFSKWCDALSSLLRR
jgi:hypothetical protein